MSDLHKQRTKNHVKSELQASNWDLQSFESKQDISVMIYLYDPFDTEDFMLAGLREKDMAELNKAPYSMTDIVASMDITFTQFASATKKNRAHWTDVLGGLLGMYMLKTKTYEKFRKVPVCADQMKQFIVLRYKNRYVPEATFRPFYLVTEAKVLPPEDVRELASSVIERDEAINASFFNFSPVSKIKE